MWLFAILLDSVSDEWIGEVVTVPEAEGLDFEVRISVGFALRNISFVPEEDIGLSTSHV